MIKWISLDVLAQFGWPTFSVWFFKRRAISSSCDIAFAFAFFIRLVSAGARCTARNLILEIWSESAFLFYARSVFSSRFPVSVRRYSREKDFCGRWDFALGRCRGIGSTEKH